MSFSVAEYTKIDIDWGFAPDPTGGAYSAPQTPFKGATSRQERNGGEGRKGEGGREEVMEKGEWGRERKRG